MIIYENKNYKVTNEKGYVKILKKNSGNENICIPYPNYKKTIETVGKIDDEIILRLPSSMSAPIETVFRFDETEYKNITDACDKIITKWRINNRLR